MRLFPEVGYSKYTPQKQDHFNRFIFLHLKLASIIINKHLWASKKYCYFDLTAGPGIYEDVLGSPVLFLNQAVRIKNMKFDIVFIEESENCYSSLRENIIPYSGFKIRTFNDRCESVLPNFFIQDHSSFGLIYVDPTGKTPPFDLLSKISVCRKRTDILIHFTGANIKRIFKSPFTSCNQRLIDFLEPIQKTSWLIREPYAKHQWSFLFGTNWPKYPDYEEIGFHRLESERGKKIFNLLNFTHEELEEQRENRKDQNRESIQRSFSYCSEGA